MGTEKAGPTPVLVEMRALEKGRTLNELVAQHLVRSGVEQIDVRKFRYMLEKGRIVLLFDGFDELALRVTYDCAAAHLSTLLEAAQGEAKIVVTSRTQHFISDKQITTALGEQVERLRGRRVARLQPFGEGRIRWFLLNRLKDDAAADARFRLINEVKDLLGLSGNPRMLAFIAELEEDKLRAAKVRDKEITSASLYRLLLERWLVHEYERQQPEGALPALTVEDRWSAVTQVALRLWQEAERTVSLTELSSEVGEAIKTLVEGLSPDVATHQVGSGSLLVRVDEGEFAFIHQSVLEWLVARRAARQLERDGRAEVLERREISALMADFLVGLAERDRASKWAEGVLAGGFSEAAVKNAHRVRESLGETRAVVFRAAGKDLRGQDFSSQNLPGADLEGSDLSGVRMVDAVLRRARLAGAVLVGADLSRADLRGADLRGADLREARLLGADLREAELAGADLRRARLVGARVEAEALTQARTSGAARPLPERIEPWLPAEPTEAWAIAWSPDGTLLASGHGDGSIHLHEAEPGQGLRRFKAHQARVTSLAFSPRGEVLASASEAKTVRLWNLDDGALIRTLPKHQDGVTSVAFSPRGDVLASASKDRTIRLWNNDWVLLRTLEGHQDDVTSVAFNPQGTVLASGSGDKTVLLWNVGDGALIRTLRNEYPVTSVAFSQRTNILASGSGTTVCLWNVGDGTLIRKLEEHPEPVTSVAFSLDRNILAAGCIDRAFTGSITKLWNVEDGTLFGTIRGRDDASRISVAFEPQGRALASASKASLVCFWSIGGDDSWIKELEVDPVYTIDWLFEKNHNTLAFSPRGNILASVSRYKRVGLWNLDDGTFIRILEQYSGSITSITFSPRGDTFASVFDDKLVGLWNLDDRALIRILEGHRHKVRNLAFNPKGDILASASDDKTIRLWNLDDGGLIRDLVGHRAGVESVAFSPRGEILASASDDRTVRLWNIEDGDLIRVLVGHKREVNSVAFSPQGSLLASASDDRTVRLWNPDDGRLLQKLEGHEGAIECVAFSPDGQTLASASKGGTVRLWHVAGGRCFAVLAIIEEGWVAFTPDGRYKLGGETGDAFWHSIGLCRFEPGELDPYLPEPLRVPDDQPLW